MTRSEDLDTARERVKRTGGSSERSIERERRRERSESRSFGRGEEAGESSEERRRARRRARRSRSRSRDRDRSRDRSGGRNDGAGGRASEDRVGAGRADDVPAPPREEANFGLSGLLAAESNSARGVALKYVEPVGEARAPSGAWRLYVFKGDVECEEPYRLAGTKTKYLIGRDRAVADIPSDHPSCSKQHCVIQFRDVDDGRGSLPYAFDLGSANGTFVNRRRVEPNAYIALKSKDVIKFGASTRDYVLVNEDDALESAR